MLYTTCQCKKCNKEFVLLSKDIRNMNIDDELVCPYCRSIKVHIEKTDLRECMRARAYRRVKSALKEIE